MPRKKVEQIETLGDTDKLTVQKSRPLFALWRSKLSLAEFKILDTYLARIDSHNPDRRRVVFEKGELEELLGVKKINMSDLDERLAHLMTSVKIEDEQSKRGFTRVALFERAQAEHDRAGAWTVQLECTKAAMKYIFNVENIGYLRYKLRCITALKSRQAYILFMYLEQNRFRTPFVVDLDTLKTILCCEKEESYKQFKRFNDLVLKRVQKELNEKTECRFEYETVKTGRKVTAIRFKLQTLPKIAVEEDENQMTIEEWQAETEEPKHEVWRIAIESITTDHAKLDEVQALISLLPTSKLPQVPGCPNNIELMRYHYLDHKVVEINRRDSDKKINDKYAYLISMIKHDLK